MKVEEKNEDILQQDREYNPTDDFDDLLDDDDVPLDDNDEPEHKDGEDVERKKLVFNPKILAVVAIIGAVLLIVAIAIGTKKGSKSDVITDEEVAEIASTEDVFVDMFAYTDEEVEALRQAGYTGYEIEDNEFNEIPAETLITEAEEQRKALYEKELVPYLDSASDEFKMLKSKTWLGLDEIEIPEGTDSSNLTYVTSQVNADYEKIGSRGMQCFIHYFMADGNEGFMTLAPDRYIAINESGNMVIRITYCTLSNGIRVITKAEEVIVE